MPRGRFTHGCYAENRRLYAIWAAMYSRCYRPGTNDFSRYGGRGISVCDEWRDVRAFFCWATENGYAEGLTIDRIDGNGDYCPQNCRWVTSSQQMRNRSSNRIIEFEGHSMTMADWAEKIGLPYRALQGRLKNGWAISRALTEPYKLNFKGN